MATQYPFVCHRVRRCMCIIILEARRIISVHHCCVCHLLCGYTIAMCAPTVFALAVCAIAVYIFANMIAICLCVCVCVCVCV